MLKFFKRKLSIIKTKIKIKKKERELEAVSMLQWLSILSIPRIKKLKCVEEPEKQRLIEEAEEKARELGEKVVELNEEINVLKKSLTLTQ